MDKSTQSFHQKESISTLTTERRLNTNSPSSSSRIKMLPRPAENRVSDALKKRTEAVDGANPFHLIPGYAVEETEIHLKTDSSTLLSAVLHAFGLTEHERSEQQQQQQKVKMMKTAAWSNKKKEERLAERTQKANESFL